MIAGIVEANSGEKIQKDQKCPNATSEELWAKEGAGEQKQGTVPAPWTQQHKGVGKPPKPPLQLDPWTHPYPQSFYFLINLIGG